MRASQLGISVLVWLGSAGSTLAQSPLPVPMVRFDVQGTVGWVSASHPEFLDYDDWDHGIAQGAAGVGWYWSDHLKTEVEFQANSSAEFYGFEEVRTEGRVSWRNSRYDVRDTGAAIGQVYQFGRNAWVHPFLGAGVDLRWRTVTEEVQPLVVWDSGVSAPREVQPGYQVGPATSFEARPFAIVGVKAYLAKRAFFRGDFRVGVHSGVAEVVTRVGFGVDF